MYGCGISVNPLKNGEKSACVPLKNDKNYVKIPLKNDKVMDEGGGLPRFHACATFEGI